MFHLAAVADIPGAPDDVGVKPARRPNDSPDCRSGAKLTFPLWPPYAAERAACEEEEGEVKALKLRSDVRAEERADSPSLHPTCFKA